MNYYQDITLIPDPDIALGFLWQKVFQQVHIALVDNKVAPQYSAIAVAFPDYGSSGFPLGKKLRLLAPEKILLDKLNVIEWLSRFSDYVHIKSIQQVPEKTIPVCFIRQHVKGAARINNDMQNKAHRWSQKTGKSLDECMTQLEKSKPLPGSDWPYIWLESQQTKQRVNAENSKFPLFIKRLEMKGTQSGFFSCYGLSQLSPDLSKIATVPHF